MPKKIDLRDLLTYKIVALSREISFYNQREMNLSKDLKIAHLRALSLLYSVGRCNQTEFIYSTLRGDPGNTSRYISTLKKKGYVLATNDSEDRRIKWLTLTPKGNEVAALYINNRSLHNKKLTAEFTDAELKQLEKLLSKASHFYSKINYS